MHVDRGRIKRNQREETYTVHVPMKDTREREMGKIIQSTMS